MAKDHELQRVEQSHIRPELVKVIYFCSCGKWTYLDRKENHVSLDTVKTLWHKEHIAPHVYNQETDGQYNRRFISQENNSKMLQQMFHPSGGATQVIRIKEQFHALKNYIIEVDSDNITYNGTYEECFKSIADELEKVVQAIASGAGK